MTVHVRWPARPAELGPGLIFLVLFASRQKEQNNCYVLILLSFACTKESNKEKCTANDVRPLADALIKLWCYC